MDVVVNGDRIHAAIDETVNALQATVLLAGQIQAEQRELRRAIDRAGRALAALTPKKDEDAPGPRSGGRNSAGAEDLCPINAATGLRIYTPDAIVS